VASFTEKETSGEGDKLGFDVHYRIRMGTLIVDTVTDDPIAKLQSLIRPESRHPKDNNVFLRQYNIINRVAPLAWFVSMEYDKPSTKGIAQIGNWLVTIRSNTGTETLWEEIPAESTEGPLRQQIIGNLKYEVTEGPDEGPSNATHKTDSARPIYLKQIDGIVNPRGEPIISGNTSLIFRCTTNVMSARIMRSVADMKRGVNREKILKEFPPGTLLFADFSIEERIGSITGLKGEYYLYDNQLEFLYDPNGHTPFTRTDTYTDADGFEQVVLRIGDDNPETRTFRKYPQISINTLLASFPNRAFASPV